MSESHLPSLDEMLGIHADQTRAYESESGLRDLELLRSPRATPKTTFEGVCLHPRVFEMAPANRFHLGDG